MALGQCLRSPRSHRFDDSLGLAKEDNKVKEKDVWNKVQGNPGVASRVSNEFPVNNTLSHVMSQLDV